MGENKVDINQVVIDSCLVAKFSNKLPHCDMILGVHQFAFFRERLTVIGKGWSRREIRSDSRECGRISIPPD